MSGFVAIFDPEGADGPVAPMAERLPSRAGSRDEWRDACFAAVRLHHGRVARAPQPVWSRCGNICLFMDGELFAPGAAGAAEGSGADAGPAECLRLYQEGRPEAFAELDGSFALIIYDAARRAVTLVSDRLNTRAIYYFTTGRGLVVGSHIAALTAHPRCPKVLDRQALHEIIAYQRVIGDRTIYRGIERVPPASLLRFDGRAPAVRAYWRLRWREPEFAKRDVPDLLAGSIRRAVRRRLPADDRHGLLLSGGLDSRLILAAADRPPICFTQAGADNQEVKVAREAARLAGASFHFVPVEPERYWDHFDEAVRLTSGMLKAQAGHFLPALETVAQHCDIVLTGYGFDTIYRGMYLPKKTIDVRGRPVISVPWLTPVDKGQLVPTLADSIQYALPSSLVSRLLAPEARRGHRERLEQAMREALRDFELDGGGSLQNAWDYVNLRSYSQHHTFPNVLCVRSRADERIVSLDRDLFDLYLQMPPEWRHPDMPYRAALRQVLPPAMLRLAYAKTGVPASWHPLLASAAMLSRQALQRMRLLPRPRLSHPLASQGSWPSFGNLLRLHPPFRERLQALAGSEALLACGIFDRAGLAAAVDEHCQGGRDHSKTLLVLLTLDSWLRQFGATGAE